MCVSPNSIKVNGEWITVPCNRCFECIRLRKLNWEQRIMAESFVSDACFFSLISYDEEHYPDPDLPEKREIQLLLKRLRTRLNRLFDVPKAYQETLGPTVDPLSLKLDKDKPIELKYFIVSEYGEKLNRLHYHAIFFVKNVDRTSFNRVFWKSFLETTWSKGFCSAYNLEYKWASYACKYIQKSYNMMLHSRLGKRAFLDNFNKENDDLTKFQINGRATVAPRSWNKELHGDQEYSLFARKSALRTKPVRTTFKDKVLIDKKFRSEHPESNRPAPVRQRNDDILPNNDF